MKAAQLHVVVSAMVLVGCASAPQRPVAEWREPAGTSSRGPACASAPSGADAVLVARLGPLETIIESSTPAAEKVVAVRSLEPAFEEFRIAEIAACRLLSAQKITLAQYDTFLDSVALRLPAAALDQLPAAPAPLSPRDGAVFNRYPRTTTLEWAPVQGAASYVVEIQFEALVYGIGPNGERTPLPAEWGPERGGLHAYEVEETGLRFEFAGAAPGRWRVRALDALGRAGPASPWRSFRYTR